MSPLSKNWRQFTLAKLVKILVPPNSLNERDLNFVLFKKTFELIVPGCWFGGKKKNKKPLLPIYPLMGSPRNWCSFRSSQS